jgi:hypothetical protein
VKRREEWWECPDPSCGAQIQFLMVGPTSDRIDPSCFCGNKMRRVLNGAGSRWERRSNRLHPPSAKVRTTIETGITGVPLE